MISYESLVTLIVMYIAIIGAINILAGAFNIEKYTMKKCGASEVITGAILLVVAVWAWLS